MSLRAKLIVVILFVGLAPLLVSAATSLRIHQSAFDGALEKGQRQAATQVATTVREIQRGALRQLTKAAQALPWSHLGDDELRGALNILYQQDDGIAVVALFDARGESVVESVFVGPQDGGLHPTGLTELRGRLYESMPPWAKAGETGLGTPFAGDSQGTVLLPIAATVEGRGGRAWTVAFAWSIAGICAAIVASSLDQTQTILALNDGRVLCPAPGQEPLSALPEEVVVGLVKAGKNGAFRYQKAGQGYSAVVSRPTDDWVLLVEQPTALAKKPSQRIFRQSVFWLGAGLVIAVSAGVFLAQGISGRVKALAIGAEKLGEGDLSHRIADTGGDELATLAETFNKMGGEIEKRRAEIEAWNQTLQDKVDERTRELEKAQQKLLESQKITAVSSLAAGLAHEINNPLTGVLGWTQLLRGRFAKQEGGEKTVKALTSIEDQAKRIREIVETLQSLSEEESGGVSGVSLEPLVINVVGLLAGQADEAKVRITYNVEEGLAQVAADVGDLRRAFLHLVKNAVAASEPGDEVSIKARAIGDDMVRIIVADEGMGISKEHTSRVFEPFFTTKKEWGGKGLGLTEVYRIVEQYHGRIDIHSDEGEGTVISVYLPVYRGGAHLA